MSARPASEFSEFQSPHEASLDKLVEALDIAYHRPWLMVWRSFVHGLFTAIGATVGTFLIIILLGYSVHLLGGVELLKGPIDRLQQIILQSQSKNVNTIIESTKLNQ